MKRRTWLQVMVVGLGAWVSAAADELPVPSGFSAALKLSQLHGVRLTLDDSQRVIGIDASGQPAGDLVLQLAGCQENLLRLHLTAKPGPQLSDAGLAHLRRMPHLESLQIVGTGMSDHGLAALAELHELDTLLLHGPFSDAGLQSIGGLWQLEILDLFGTRVRRLPFAPGLRRLRVLNLDSTQVDNEGLAQLTGLLRLEQLSLRHTRIGNDGLASLPPNLRRLYLDGTAIGNGGLAPLGRLQGLTHLSLEGTAVNDADVASLAGLNLQGLSLRRTAITRAALISIARIPTLQTLELGGIRIRPRDLMPLIDIGDALKNLDVGDCALEESFRNLRSLLTSYRGRLVVDFDDALRPKSVRFTGQFSSRDLQQLRRQIGDPEVLDIVGLTIDDERTGARSPGEDSYAALRDFLKGATRLRHLILPDSFTPESVERFRRRFPKVVISVRPRPLPT